MKNNSTLVKNLLSDYKINIYFQNISLMLIGTLVLAFSEISVVKSNKVTGIFALHNWAAIPLPIVPEPITTTLLIFIMRIKAYNENLIQEQLKAIKYFNIII